MVFTIKQIIFSALKVTVYQRRTRLIYKGTQQRQMQLILNYPLTFTKFR